MAPVQFIKLFRYASKRDILLLLTGCLFILYSSLNIPLVNIIYGLMMKEMNNFVSRKTQSFNLSMTNGTETITSSESEKLFINNSYNLCMIIILFGVTRFVALYLALLFFSIAASNQAKRVKLLFFKALLRQEVAWFERNRTGDFAIRITSDLSKFEEGIGEKIALCLNALFAWISSLVSSFYYGWELTLICLVLVPLTIFITTVIAELQATYSIRESSALSRAFNVCHEVISSIRTVLSFSGQQKEAQRFKQGLDSAYKYGLKRNMFAGLNLGFTWMSGYLGFAICLLYSTKFYKPEYYGQYDEAHIITILWSAAGCVFLLNRMMPFIETIQMARGSASNLFSVIERKSQIDVTCETGLKPKLLEANVRFEYVSFTYPNSCYQQSQQQTSDNIENVKEPIVGGHIQEVDDENLNLSPSTTTTTTTGAGSTIRSSRSPSQSSASSSSASSSTSSTPTLGQTNIHHQEHTLALDDEHKELDTTTTTGAIQQQQQQPTIKNMSMEVKSGQTIALVGPSGSGKSTALALLQRFYDIDSGSITLNGHNLKELNLGWLRGQFGVVTQEPVLFDMSIADNIRLGARPGQYVSDFDIEQAARSANAHAFIVRLPNGYETRAGTRGVQLSGGQKQRIAIARALVRHPKILLLDEATSALDLESESIVQKALDQARIGRTTFIVAHRLSTVRNADKIIVFDKGTIVESGTHEKLLQLRGLYYQINVQQRQGIDLLPVVRRNSQLGGQAPTIGGPFAGCGVTNSSMHQSLHEQHSLSVYSTTGKYNAATSGFGATGHGGNGEGVDNEDSRFNDDEYFRQQEDDTEESEETTTDPQTTDDEIRQRILLHHDDEHTQGSLLAGDSTVNFGDGVGGAGNGGAGGGGGYLINSKGKKVTNLSILNVLRFIKPDFALSFVGVITSLLMGFCIPISAMIIGDIARIFSTDNPDDIREGLYSHGLLYTGLAVFAFIVSFIQVVSFGTAGEKIGINLRVKGFQAIMQHDITWFDHKRNNPGSICARLASDVGNVQSITGNRTAVIFQSFSILVSTFLFAIYFNLKFSSICALFVAILLITTIMQARYSGKLAIANRGFDSEIGKIVLESSANIKTLVSLHQEEYFIERCERLLMKDRRSKSLDNHLRLSLESLKYAMTAISKGSSFYFAALMLLRDEITIDVIFKLIEIILYGLTEASKSLIFISDLEKARRGTQNLYKLIYNNNHNGNNNNNSGSKSLQQLQQQQDNGGGNGGAGHHHHHQRRHQHYHTHQKQQQQQQQQPLQEKHYLPRLLLTAAGDLAASPAAALQANRDGYSKLVEQQPTTTATATVTEHPHQTTKLPTSSKLIDFEPEEQETTTKTTTQAAGGQLMSGNNLPRCQGNICFQSVQFHYPSRPDACVLKSLNVDIPAGKSIALVGRSGCGKSTIIQLLERFYDYSKGQILLDSSELKSLPIEWVRKQIALVSQEPTLLSYTIGDNIRYGDNSREVTFEEVVRAAQVANIHDFIMGLPEQYDTKLSESNSLQLSGGQKQRIAIARALIRQAPILVFDEATSALDTKSERIVQEALDRARVGKTSLIIAHRLSTIKSADRIVVLKEGVVVEQGTHQELLEKRGEYYCLYKTQSKL